MAKIKKKGLDKGKKSFVIWMTLTGFLLVGSYAAFLGIRSKPPKKVGAYGHTPLQTTEVEDPVCWMKVKPPAAGHVEYRAKHYYFCSISCKEDFEKEPEKYIKGKDRKEMK
ncbi:MAG: YHS domain-containing protein [Deltaproteobacteria bacterium]|nr:YHS domain-containing protein [Deltaproteobacteria bacterium]